MKAALLPGIPEEGEPLLRLKGEGVPGRSGILGNNDWRMERDSGPMGGFHNVFRLAAFSSSLIRLDAISRVFTFFRAGTGKVSFARPILPFSILLPGLLHPPGAPPLFATPCRGHGLVDRLGTGARRVQRLIGGFFALIVWSPASVFLFAGEHTLFSSAYKVKIKFSYANSTDSKKPRKTGFSEIFSLLFTPVAIPTSPGPE